MSFEPWSKLLCDPSRRQIYEKRVGELDADIGSFLSFGINEPDKNIPEGPLEGMPIGIKDNIAVKGRPLTCGSRILENFIAPYTATVVEALQNSGAQVVGKTNLDEFGMGSSNENSALGKTVNPWNSGMVPGGSSGGSAASVAAGLVPIALGSDTGGSVRQPANFCGIYGLKPTYGALSRYGLTAYASSLEVIGAMSRDIDVLEKFFSIMKGMDDRDQSSLSPDIPAISKKRIAVLEFGECSVAPAVDEACTQVVDCLKSGDYSVSRVVLPSMDLIVPAYFTIATAEASANLARYNGIRYGMMPPHAANVRDLMCKTRADGLGDEVKFRILLGTYVLRSGFQDQYYGRAQKIRTLIRHELAHIFAKYDLILMPVYPTQAFPRGDGCRKDHEQRLGDIFTCLANLAGLPALALPVGLENGLPTGVQFMAPAFGEESLFDMARYLANIFKIQSPPIYLDPGNLQ